MTWKGVLTIPLMIACLLLLAAAVGFVMTKERHGVAGRMGKSQSEMSVFPGFTVAELPPPDAGLVVTSLRTRSEAQRDCIAVGDRILAIDGRPVRTIRDAATMLGASRDTVIALQLSHNHSAHDIMLHRHERHIHGA